MATDHVYVASLSPGRRWVIERGSTCWLPVPAFQNADGTIREPWFR